MLIDAKIMKCIGSNVLFLYVQSPTFIDTRSALADLVVGKERWPYALSVYRSVSPVWESSIIIIGICISEKLPALLLLHTIYFWMFCFNLIIFCCVDLSMGL